MRRDWYLTPNLAYENLCTLISIFAVCTCQLYLKLDTARIELNLIGPYMKCFSTNMLLFFLPINLNMCFGCSKEPFHWMNNIHFGSEVRKVIFHYILLSERPDKISINWKPLNGYWGKQWRFWWTAALQHCLYGCNYTLKSNIFCDTPHI